MSTVAMSTEQRLVLDNISWRAYNQLLKTLTDHPGLRLTYNRTQLEIMTISHEHESYADFLGRMVIILTEECGLPVKSGRTTTLRRRRKQRGLEPDNCYWITNESQVRGKLHIDFAVDPPPDLAIEIEVSRGELDRMAIYAALGVSEVWRFDTQKLTFNILTAEGFYRVSPSMIFPHVSADDLLRFLNLPGQMEENAAAREFRNWVRQRVADGWK